MPSSDVNQRQYVRNSLGIWTPVGLGTSDAPVPVAITSPNGLAVGSFGSINPFQSLNVSTDSNLTFIDSFEAGTIDTQDIWTLSGTVNPSVPAVGSVNLNPSTTASATSAMNSQNSFNFVAPCVVGGQVTFETAAVLGNHRFFGLGVPPSVPGTAAAPLQDAVGFEIDTSGVMRASVYNAGTRVFTQTMTKPTDGAQHKVAMWLRGDYAFFYMDQFEVPAAFSYLGPARFTLPIRLHSLNSASVTGGTPTFNASGFIFGDMSNSSGAISDGQFGWRKAHVDAVGALRQVPRSADLVVSTTAAVGNAVTCTLPAAGANQFHFITGIAITKYATANIGASATPVVVTSTNIPGSMAHTFETTQQGGEATVRQQDFMLPLKSSVANTATTIVCPATTNVIWRVTTTYFTGQA